MLSEVMFPVMIEGRAGLNLFLSLCSVLAMHPQCLLFNSSGIWGLSPGIIWLNEMPKCLLSFYWLSLITSLVSMVTHYNRW